jgi:hypothetical protein
MTDADHTVAEHFERRSPVVRQSYDAILAAARQLGPVIEEPKKTSIHLVRRTAFGGVATQKEKLVLTLKSPAAQPSTRIHKQEQASANRWHLQIHINHPSEIDAEVQGWLKQAWEMSA